MRHLQAFYITNVAQQQVIKVAAMARCVDDDFFLGDILQTLNMTEFDAVVDSIPQPTQETQNYPNGRIGNVGRDLVYILVDLALQGFSFFRVVAALGLYDPSDVRCQGDLSRQRAPMR